MCKSRSRTGRLLLNVDSHTSPQQLLSQVSAATLGTAAQHVKPTAFRVPERAADVTDHGRPR